MRDILFVGVACLVGAGAARVLVEVARVWGVTNAILVGGVAALVGAYLAVALGRVTGRDAYALFIIMMVGFLTPGWPEFFRHGFTPWAAALAGACAGGAGANLVVRSSRRRD